MVLHSVPPVTIRTKRRLPTSNVLRSLRRYFSLLAIRADDWLSVFRWLRSVRSFSFATRSGERRFSTLWTPSGVF